MNHDIKRFLLGGKPPSELTNRSGFKYPEHFKHMDDITKLYFPLQVHRFERNLKPLFNKSNICLEIGTHYGAASVWILEKLCKEEGSHLYMMDVTAIEGYTLLQNNLAPYKNCTYMEGESRDLFKTFHHNGQIKEFLDFVYVDGEHESKYVLEDAVNAFYCLKPGGIICFDDYGEGVNYNFRLFVKNAVDAFELCFKKELEVIESSYQKWYIKRRPDEIKKNLI